MNKLSANIDFLNKTRVKVDEKLFSETITHTLSYLKKEGQYVLSVTIVNSKEMQKLNREYKGKDAPTDVLTFPYSSEKQEDEPFVDLGSVILCHDICKKEAEKRNENILKTYALLLIHGILHIFGYDHHRSKSEEKEMFSLQEKIVDTLCYDFITDMKLMKKCLKEAQSRAYTPYSHFNVGAVVVTKDGKYHLGCNIENSAYSVACCAERVALFKVISQGYKKEDIVSLGCITSSSNIGTPCGVCRQAMAELMNLKCPVYIFNNDMDKKLFTTVEGLLPYSFSSEDLFAK